MRSRTKSTKSIAFSLVVFMLVGLLAGFSNTHLVVSAFVPVSYITLSSCIATAGTQFTLKAAISPDFATNQNITWTVVDGEATGATIVDNAVLHTTADGLVKVRATVSDGSGYGQDFYTTFTITVGKAKIANVYPRKTYPESPRPKIKSASVQLPDTASEITFVSMTTPVGKNEDATVTVQGLPNTEYDITVYYPSGISTAEGLEKKRSDADGNVSWTWRIGGNTSLQTHYLTITGGNSAITVYFTVR